MLMQYGKSPPPSSVHVLCRREGLLRVFSVDTLQLWSALATSSFNNPRPATICRNQVLAVKERMTRAAMHSGHLEGVAPPPKARFPPRWVKPNVISRRCNLSSGTSTNVEQLWHSTPDKSSQGQFASCTLMLPTTWRMVFFHSTVPPYII